MDSAAHVGEPRGGGRPERVLRAVVEEPLERGALGQQRVKCVRLALSLLGYAVNSRAWGLRQPHHRPSRASSRVRPAVYIILVVIRHAAPRRHILKQTSFDSDDLLRSSSLTHASERGAAARKVEWGRLTPSPCSRTGSDALVGILVGDKEEPSSKRGHGDACASAGGVWTATLASRPLREPATASSRRRLDYVNQWGQGAAAPCPNVLSEFDRR